MRLVQIATKVAWRVWGEPYKWAGDDPMEGFDCSGAAIEICRSVGKLPRKGDWKAVELYKRFTKTLAPKEGCLVFYGADAEHITHVGYCIDHEHYIGAEGGGPTTTTEAAAIAQNAYACVRPIHSRPNLVGYVDPFTEEERSVA